MSVGDPETAFAKLLTRQPTDKEVQSLYRVKNALGIRDNDALWLVLMALESYDTLYRRYPEMISDHALKVLETQRLAIAEVATFETQKALSALSDAVSNTAQSIATRHADVARLQGWAWTLVATVFLTTSCLFVGFVLGSGRLPYWAIYSASQGFLRTLFGAIARTPVGYVAAVTASVAAIHCLARAVSRSQPPRRIYLVASSIALLCVSALFLLSIFFDA